MLINDLDNAFGEWVRTARAQMQLTVRDFAKQTEVDIGTISRLENGHTKVLLDTVIRLCNGLGMSQDEFVRRFLKDEISPQLELDKRVILSSSPPLLTVQDVENFLGLFREQNNRGKSILIDLLNNTNEKLKEMGKYPETANPHILVDKLELLFHTTPLYKFELQYPSDIDNEMILKIYMLGGALIPTDIGTYVRNLRLKKQLVLSDMATSVGRSRSGLNRIEIGLIGRIKLVDVLMLDDFYEQEGKIFALFWKVAEFNARILQSDRWTELEAKVGTFLVTIARWRQFLDWSDLSWLDEFRAKIQADETEAKLVVPL